MPVTRIFFSIRHKSTCSLVGAKSEKNKRKVVTDLEYKGKGTTFLSEISLNRHLGFELNFFPLFVVVVILVAKELKILPPDCYDLIIASK